MTPQPQPAKSSADGSITLSREEAQAIDRALTKTITSAIAFYSDEPYPDDPRWTPWTRFGKPLAARAEMARKPVREALRND
jgi:hypothetical protein